MPLISTASLHLLNQDCRELQGLLAVQVLLFCLGIQESLEGHRHLCLLEMCLDQEGLEVLDGLGNLKWKK